MTWIPGTWKMHILGDTKKEYVWRIRKHSNTVWKRLKTNKSNNRILTPSSSSSSSAVSIMSCRRCFKRQKPMRKTVDGLHWPGLIMIAQCCVWLWITLQPYIIKQAKWINCGPWRKWIPAFMHVSYVSWCNPSCCNVIHRTPWPNK